MQKSILCLGLAAILARAQLYDATTNAQQRLQANAPCDILAAIFPTKVFLPGQTNYTLGEEGCYSAQQSELRPACRFFPVNAGQIQQALADVVIPQNVSIGVVSGGQSSIQGASNVQSGITIDLSNITDVNFFLDPGKATWLGVGNRWKDAYAILENANLTVAGSRSAYVGVGGHVLSGGTSWYSNQLGWAFDSVTDIEVVTPNAKVLQLSATKNEDLFWALRGSPGAFGIVTKVKMTTIPHNGVYGGSISYQQKDMPQLCDALNNMAHGADQDPTTQGYLSFAWIESKKDFLYTAYLMDTEGKTTSGSVKRFRDIPHAKDTLRSMTISESADEINKSSPSGLRRSQFTLTTTMDTAIMSALHTLVKDFTPGLNFDKAGILKVTYEPLTRPHLQKQQNYFGIGPVTGPLLLIHVEFSWSDAASDDHIESKVQELRRAMEAEAMKRKTLHPFIHPGYAAKDQDPYSALAPLDKRMLQAFRRKYDPNDSWRDLVPGVWHI